MKRTSILFAIPSFLGGVATVLDMGSTLTVYNTSETPEKADYNAIYADWLAVGDDIIYSIERLESENVKK